MKGKVLQRNVALFLYYYKKYFNENTGCNFFVIYGFSFV